MTLHLGWCSPLPPARTGIADYSAELLPLLAERCELTCFVPTPEEVAPELRQHVRVRRLDAVVDAADVLPVYHVGNHVEFHGGILRAALRRPGLLILHEIVLYDLVERLLLGAGQVAGFKDWVRAAVPDADRALVRRAARGRVAPYDLPLCEPLVRASRMTVVFNRWAQGEVQRHCPHASVVVVPQHCVLPPANTVDRTQLREQYRLPADGFIVGSFGYQTPSKRIEVGLAAFAQLHREHPNTAYLFAGPSSARLDVRALAARLGVGDAVHCFGYVSEPMWWDLLACTDLCISLRGPTQGETSSSILKQLTAGKAVCVSAAGPDAGYPAAAVCHIPQSDDEIDQLGLALRRALNDPAWRAQLERAAQAYVRDEHSLPGSADAMVAACERAAGVPVPQDRFDFDAALSRSRGLAATWRGWWYRVRLARTVGRRHGWGAVMRRVRTDAARAGVEESHAHSH